MRVYVCDDHDSLFPVGACSVVVAEHYDQARDLLRAELRTHGLNPDKQFTLRELNTSEPRALVILDGDYLPGAARKPPHGSTFLLASGRRFIRAL